ncbi:hypothetical protein, partial [Burkholderia glumae]|uniref:hypothetical protein n=1 Tax=Burkholderia glumae TaxID=337 RepID=UPI0019D6DB15
RPDAARCVVRFGSGHRLDADAARHASRRSANENHWHLVRTLTGALCVVKSLHHATGGLRPAGGQRRPAQALLSPDFRPTFASRACHACATRQARRDARRRAWPAGSPAFSPCE